MLSEVFKLQQNVRPAPFYGRNKHANKCEVVFTGDTRMTPADIARIVQQSRIVRPDIQ
ncbi:hypothetical protein SDC9_143428 [bioreactor metagenome]|uniref:Uncharacterized protein n=1 Tax=bioreactor metagenome TaxID=1076179 RepID=A0A645E3C5_9ZZZZ